MMERLEIPPTIKNALDAGAHLVLSCSGGKDSDAMTYALLNEKEQHQWSGDVLIVHADLGRMERTETPDYIEEFSQRVGVDLVIVRHHRHDLLDGFRARMKSLQDQDRNVPPFSSAASRYCTSDWKRSPVNKFIRNQWPSDATVIVAMGIRAEESHVRAKKEVYRVRPGCQAPTKNRTVYDWNAIFKWKHHQVFRAIISNGNIKHPAYKDGNERLSCGMCVLACRGDIENGAYNRPDTYRALVDIELESGFAFQKGKPLYEVAPDLLRPDQLEQLKYFRK